MFKLFMGDKVENYAENKPGFSMEGYFNGPIKAWGIIQDWRGNVVSRFDVSLVGKWEGDTGTLTENFRYYDGSTQKRIWKITRQKDGTYTGEASDIVGKARGQVSGGAGKWQYSMDVPVDNRTFRLKFDDWMWQMNDGILINRSYLKKFGFTVAELTLFMQKQEQ